ncbi:hypothetical protein GOP47_0012470 [Adiantum capillus-veneris]|uniref:Uncharacterized protein n=1 Tax=Adiantum capillus-veneris TaxID=13818 RepID=A0A9D4UQQ7_ADICA|nr:hypothetical protein GOP47_0012470 [Adiantum capillus-veneris]
MSHMKESTAEAAHHAKEATPRTAEQAKGFGQAHDAAQEEATAHEKASEAPHKAVGEDKAVATMRYAQDSVVTGKDQAVGALRDAPHAAKDAFNRLTGHADDKR